MPQCLQQSMRELVESLTVLFDWMYLTPLYLAHKTDSVHTRPPCAAHAVFFCSCRLPLLPSPALAAFCSSSASTLWRAPVIIQHSSMVCMTFLFPDPLSLVAFCLRGHPVPLTAVLLYHSRILHPRINSCLPVIQRHRQDCFSGRR